MRERVLAVPVCAILAALCVSAPAQAAFTHPYTGTSLGPGGAGSGSFGNVQAVTVDQRDGDVLVYDDSEGGRVYRFDAAGAPVDFSSTATNSIEGVGGAGADEEELAIDSSSGPDAGDIYVANNSIVRIYSESGAFLGELSGGEMCGVAVDPSGAVYVGLYGQVEKLVPSANPVTNADRVATMAGASGVCNLAVDSSGNVFGARWSNGPVTRYEASQFGSISATGSIAENIGSTLAVDPADDHVYVDQGDRVAELGAHGEPFEEPLATFGESGEGALSGSYGIGVSETSGDIYASNGHGQVSVFGPGVLLPNAATEAATGVAQTEATLRGSVNPEGTATTYQFEYGTSSSYGSLAPATPASVGSDSTEHALQAALSGLQEGTTYHYRIVATNANGTARGADTTFRTTGPPAVDGESSGAVDQAEAQIEATVDPGGFDTTYSVQYGPTEAYGSATAPVDVGSGTADQSVSVQLTGLQPGSLYHYRVVASNSHGSASGADQTFTTLPVAVVSEESASNVGSSSATLAAQVDPLGGAASYRYEYGTTTAYGSSTPTTSLGVGGGSVAAVARLQNLSPGTTYHFRIVVSSALGAVQGQDATFSTLEPGAAGLPDGRGYELVTPARNEGVQVYGPSGSGIEFKNSPFPEIVYTGLPGRAAADGNSIAFVAEPNAEGNGSQGPGKGNEYTATRSPSGGWSQRNLQPPGFRSPTFVGFSPNLSVSVLQSEQPLTPGVSGKYAVLYTRATGNGSLHPLFTVTPPDRTPGEFGTATPEGSGRQLGFYYGGASADSRRQFFEANDALTPNAIDGGSQVDNVYESDEGVLRLVNVLPDGSTEPNAFIGAPPAENEAAENSSHAISADGSRVFWTDVNTGALYVRENGVSTSLIAEHATFLTAAADGSCVLYAQGGDLYEDDLGDGVTSDLAPGAELLGIAGASEDAAYVYFVAKGDLAAGAAAGRLNLYLHHGATTTFIATLGTASEESLGYFYAAGGFNDWSGALGHRTAEASPDGHGLVFQSKQSLTGYDNRSPGGERMVEVFVYDATTGSLSCVSCLPSGERPSGLRATVSGYLPVSLASTYQPRLISEGGGRVFFQSDDGLVPQDVNHRTDVYEWERDGAGSCRHATGCVYVLSGGVSQTGSYLLDASEDGSDVFFVTEAQLVDRDENDLYDVYDARVGAVAPISPPACSGTGCQGVPASPPVFATPASATYAGTGNFPASTKAPAPAKKKKAVKRGKRKKPKPKRGRRTVKRTGKERAR